MTATDPQPRSVALGGDAGSTEAPATRSTTRAWPGAIVGLAALVALAVWRLDRTSLWVDESFSLAATNKLGMSLRATKGTMGLYYVGVWLWARAGTATWWLRSFSTVAAAGTVVLTAAVARRTVGTRASWAPPVVVVGLPVVAWTATEARAYSLETFVTCAAWYCLLRWNQESSGRRDRWWTAVAVLCLIGPFCHGLFIAQVPGLALVLWLARPARSGTADDRRDGVLTVGIPVALTLVPTAAIAAWGGSEMGARWGTTPSDMVRVWWQWMLSPRPLVALVLGAVAALGTMAAVAVARSTRSRRTCAAALVPVAWVAASTSSLLAIGWLHGTYAPYYMAPTAPGVALLLGQGLRALAQGGRATRRLPVTAVAGVAAVAVVALVAFSAVTRPISIVEDWRGAAGFVADRARAGDAVAFSWEPGGRTGDESTRMGFEAAWHERSRPVTPVAISDAKPLGVPQRVIDAVPLEQVQQAWLGHDRVWVVDYQDTLERNALLDGRGIVDAYCRAERRAFAGGISVALYVRASGSCPEGTALVAAGQRTP